MGFPENKAVLKLKYDIGSWSFAATNQIIGESFIDDQFLRSRFGADTDVTDDYFAFDAVLYTDLQVQYRLQDTYQFYLGVNNLWDEEPPAILSGIPGNRNANYDIIGQYVYFGVGAEF